MNKQILLTCVLVGTFFLPANAIARKNDQGSYKPKSSVEKAEKRKKRKAKKINKKRTEKKTVKKRKKPIAKNRHVKKKTRVVEKRRTRVVAKPYFKPVPKVHRHKKKKKKKKLKHLFNKTLKLLAKDPYGYHNYYGKPRRYNTYGFNRANRHCFPKTSILSRLRRNGWRHLELINQGPNRARLFATNPYNERYKLVVHKCTGRLIKAKPLDFY